MRKVRTGAMPPAGMPRPDAGDGVGARVGPDVGARPVRPRRIPGRPLLHRLNRAEYANVIRDLLAIDVDVRSLLPADDSAFGFDNNADLLVVSPSLLDRYLIGRRSRQRAGRRRHDDGARLRHLLHEGRPVAEPAAGRPAARHRGRPWRPLHLPARRRIRAARRADAHQPRGDPRARAPASARDLGGRRARVPRRRRRRRPKPGRRARSPTGRTRPMRGCTCACP